MKQILIPVDLSPLSRKALQVAAGIAGKLNFGITLLHVVPVSGEVLVDVTGNVIDSVDFDVTAIRSQLDRSASELSSWRHDVPSTEIICKSLPGQPEGVILNEIKSGAYEMVIMATHGATGIKEFLVGSHTEHIAMKSPVPVLSIKDTEKDLSNVVYASSFSGTMETPALFGELCKALNARVTLLHIRTLSDNSSDDTIYRNMDLTAQKCGLADYKRVIHEANGVEEGIESFCSEIRAGLLVLESKGRTGLSRWVAGCVSADLINHYEHALLTFKKNQA